MKNKKRPFIPRVLNHVYQRTINGSLIFYAVSDYLVYFTLMCVLARKYKVKMLMVCLMPDHIHNSAITERAKNLSLFMHELSRLFSYEQNMICGTKGFFFEKSFGRAPKKGDKTVRTNLIYVGNNPVERQLVAVAEKYRWNIIAYATSDHPFSEKLVIRRASWNLQQVLKEVKRCREKDKPLKYNQLQRMFSKLNAKEKQQLTDYIISIYNVIDYDAAIRYFGSYEKMLIAMHSTTGSEYDINEVFVGKSDKCYAKMISICLNELNIKDIHDVLKMDSDTKMDLLHLLERKTDAPLEQIAAFLRLPVHKAPKPVLEDPIGVGRN